jgi:hypothetical protein
MSRTKKILFVVSVLFSGDFLCRPFLTYGTFSWTIQHIPPLLKAGSDVDAQLLKLDSPAKTDHRFALEMSDPLTSRSGDVLTAKANAEFPFTRSIAVPHRFRVILAPKVSRYIVKSVLNI